MRAETGSVGVVRELRVEGRSPVWIHPGWAQAFPWLAQGCTSRAEDGGPHDMSLFGEDSAGDVMERWEALGHATGMGRWVHGRQVHGSSVRLHDLGPSGLEVSRSCDGHVTASPGVLLTVSVADCVPVTVVSERPRAVALLHAGWRGTAEGVVERGVGLLGARLGADPSEVFAHLGPSICGVCYEVGPEVHQALGGARPSRAQPVDLGGVVARRLGAAGVRPERVTRSGHCTRCGDSPFYSHRGGDRARQIAFAGIRVDG